MLDPARGYDLIGDVHGCADTLQRLLGSLGYRCQQGVWRHRRRQAVFLGDLLDRGPRIREAVHLVHDMVETGQALCVMGNHEFNALAWETSAPPGSRHRFVREHNPRNSRQIRETLEQFAAYPGDWRAFQDWFLQLPLFLDGDGFRVVHACWDAQLIGDVRQRFSQGIIDQAFLQEAGLPDGFARSVFERLLCGTDMRLPDGLKLLGEDGLERSFFRTKFWEEDPQTYGDIVFQPDALPPQVARMALSGEQKIQLLRYAPHEPILFVGHYWRQGWPAAIRPNLACLDYSAVMGGKLVAYRWDQEKTLMPDRFVWVDVSPDERLV